MTNPISNLLSPLTNSCRQAITTKYMGPTNHRGSRVKATAEAGSVTISWDDALGIQENHAMAALALAKKVWVAHCEHRRRSQDAGISCDLRGAVGHGRYG